MSFVCLHPGSYLLPTNWSKSDSPFWYTCKLYLSPFWVHMLIVFVSLHPGSHLLPANLDFFNFARDESLAEEGNSRPRTPVTAEQGGQSEQTRESTPESSSSGSNMNEELLEITTPFSTVVCFCDSKCVPVFENAYCLCTHLVSENKCVFCGGISLG